MPSYDAVLSYHMTAATCGVARFNHRLAQELGVPCEPLSVGHAYRHPLISIKTSEIGVGWVGLIPPHGDLLLHDRPSRVPVGRRVLYADEIGCPATINGDPTRGRFRVLVFGMSHKRLLPHYIDLKLELDATYDDYTVEMSCAVHEGFTWAEEFERSIRDMRDIFGDKLRVLGFLGDDALAKELQECDAVAVFFDPALRANNTSAWAAVQAGKRLFTNRDERSPADPPTWPGLLRRLQPAVAETTTR